MTPQDVPAEMVTAFKRAELMAALDENDPVRAFLAHFLPAHRAMVIASIAAEPPECVVVRRDDLDAYLNRGSTGDVLREVHALRRLLAAIGDES